MLSIKNLADYEYKFINYNYSLKEVMENFKKAGNIHKEIKSIILGDGFLTEGKRYIDIADDIEKLILEKTNSDINNLEQGIGFPIGLSINECAAHWTPNPGENKLLKKDDLVKIDYGVHYGGCIVDSAFSFSLDDKFNELISISQAATNLVIKNSGVGQDLGDLGCIVEEFIESTEIELDGKIVQLKSVKDLTGHKINPWLIHGEKSIPNFSCNYPVKMEENEFYAVETFVSTGTGRTMEGMECSHYMIDTERILYDIRNKENPEQNYRPIKMDKRENFLYKRILGFRETLPFCKKWLRRQNIDKYQIPLKTLVNKGKVKSYPPLNDSKGSNVAQHEHTIMIREKANGGNIIFS